MLFVQYKMQSKSLKDLSHVLFLKTVSGKVFPCKKMFCRNSTELSLESAAFWLLVASVDRGVAMSLMQCPYYQYTGTHFANLGRMTG